MIIGSGQSTGMGDILLLTSICKHLPNCTVELSPSAERFSRFFKGQCKEVLIKENPVDLPNIGNGHYAHAKMLGLGLGKGCYLPHIEVSKEELERGEDLVRGYKNPMVFKSGCSTTWKRVREASEGFWEPAIKKLGETHTILHFGVSDNFTEFSGVVNIIDSSIPDLICYYAAIKQYLGVDTGDAHLMLACGGNTKVYSPLSTPDYRRNRWRYNSQRCEYFDLAPII
tara:strand:+ start:4818 stop:5498 length:681 start_codon:yes stop_codon:yes gene_type:complete